MQDDTWKMTLRLIERDQIADVRARIARERRRRRRRLKIEAASFALTGVCVILWLMFF